MVKVPESLAQMNFPAVAPLLCAGITTYSPLKRMGIKSGDVLGVRLLVYFLAACLCFARSK